MIVRALDSNSDWTFGAGRNNYKRGLDACQQNINTRCLEVLGDCFFATKNGIDWLNLLGGREPDTSRAIDLALRGVIMGTQNVLDITSATLTLDDASELHPTYEVQTAFGATAAQNSVASISTGSLLTELGDILTTEDGTAIGV